MYIESKRGKEAERLKNGLKHTISYIMSTDKGIDNGRTTKSHQTVE